MDVLALSTLRNPHFLSCRPGRIGTPLVIASPLHHKSRQRTEPLKATVSLRNLSPRRSDTEMLLDQAQQDLTELCKLEAGLECWKALSYFVAKRQHLEEHCNLGQDDGEHDPESCTTLNSLEKFVREQVSAGSVRNLCHNLIIMQRVEERRAAGGAASVSAAVPAITDKELHAKACLIRLFHAIDTDGKGEIGMLQFQDGLEALGAVLTEDDILQISEAIDNGRNRLDIDEFIEVMQASPLLHGVALGDDSNFLRHAAHVHGRQHTGGSNQLSV